MAPSKKPAQMLAMSLLAKCSAPSLACCAPVVLGQLAGALDLPGFLGVRVCHPVVAGDLEDFQVVAPYLDGFLDLLDVGDVDAVGVGTEADQHGVGLADEFGADHGQRLVLGGVGEERLDRVP